MKPKEVDYACPKSPPGPYYRPYEVRNNFKTEDILKCEERSCKYSFRNSQTIVYFPYGIHRKSIHSYLTTF